MYKLYRKGKYTRKAHLITREDVIRDCPNPQNRDKLKDHFYIKVPGYLPILFKAKYEVTAGDYIVVTKKSGIRHYRAERFINYKLVN